MTTALTYVTLSLFGVVICLAAGLALRRILDGPAHRSRR